MRFSTGPALARDHRLLTSSKSVLSLRSNNNKTCVTYVLLAQRQSLAVLGRPGNTRAGMVRILQLRLSLHLRLRLRLRRHQHVQPRDATSPFLLIPPHPRLVRYMGFGSIASAIGAGAYSLYNPRTNILFVKPRSPSPQHVVPSTKVSKAGQTEYGSSIGDGKQIEGISSHVRSRSKATGNGMTSRTKYDGLFSSSRIHSYRLFSNPVQAGL